MNFLHIEQKAHRPEKHFVHGAMSTETPDTKSQPSNPLREFSGILHLFAGPDPATLPGYSSVPIA